jgi:hypothetical protein
MRKVFIGPAIASEIYDSMEGARYDAQHRAETNLGPFPKAIMALSEKLASVKLRKAIELTNDEAGRLAHELDYASERVREFDASLASRMDKLKSIL